MDSATIVWKKATLDIELHPWKTIFILGFFKTFILHGHSENVAYLNWKIELCMLYINPFIDKYIAKLFGIHKDQRLFWIQKVDLITIKIV